MPSSKSLSNRALIIRALCDETFNIIDLSDSDDTQNLLSILHHKPAVIDIGAAGTNMRFLTSFLCTQPGTWEIRGSERMHQRPIGDLVKSLREIKADIFFLGKEGYPPLKIIGKKLSGGNICIDGSSSSQFISSLLMIAPVLDQGLQLTITGTIVSQPYIDMTLGLMSYFGINYSKEGNSIRIRRGNYSPRSYTVEGDWSSAAFLYSHLSCADIGTKLLIKNISSNSLQGDKKCMEYFSSLGIESNMTNAGLEIIKKFVPTDRLTYNLRNEPDLFPVLATTCASLKIPVSFEGLDTLSLKESDRLKAVAEELDKVNVKNSFTNTTFDITDFGDSVSEAIFNSHEDHRIAMAISSLIHLVPNIRIEDEHVVSKSYPKFWNDLKSLRIANIY